MAVSLEVLDNLEAPAVGITVEGLSSFESSRIAIYRQTPGKERTLVQGLGDVNVDGAGYWVDYLPPLGVPITYGVELLEGAWEGIHYEWEGTPNYSVSERIQLEETWRNEYENPTFAGGVGLVTVWENLLPTPRPSRSSARYSMTDAEAVVNGDDYREIELTADVSGDTTVYRTGSASGFVDFSSGEVFSARVGVGNPNSYPVTLRAGIVRLASSSVAYGPTRSDDVTIPAEGYAEIEVPPFEVGSGWNTIRLGVVAPSSGVVPAGTRLRMFDGFTVSRGDECPYLVHGDIALGEVAEGLRGDWYSVANNSASRLAGPRVSGVSASGAARAIRSDSWGVSGSSLLVLPGGEFLGLSELGNFPTRVRDLDLEEGEDYDISHHVGNVLPSLMVTCFHGGDMEHGALETGESLASSLGSTWWGIDAHVRQEKMPDSTSPSWDALHLSSNNYGHQGLLDMLAECDYAISFHGSVDWAEHITSPGAGPGVPYSFIGGTNEPFKEAVAASLRRHGFLCDTDVENFPTFPGTNPNNIVHQTRSGSGVQIEMSNAQRRAFFVGGDFTRPNRGNTTPEFDLYVSAVADGVRAFLDGV